MTRKEFWELRAPEKIKRQIQGAVVAAFVSGGVTGLAAVLLNPFLWIDAVLAFGLGLGIWKLQSRVCAVIICVYFIINKALALETMTAGSMIFAAVFIYYFVLGVVGTWNYQKAWQEVKMR